MKLKIVCGALIFGVNSQRSLAPAARPPSGDDERRYSQLVDMMTFYNSNFDHRKFWAYGCQCLILGDRPMSDPGHGHPVDDLDHVCKQYKDCLKCVREEHGEMCIGEFVRYKYGEKNNEVQCRNTPGSCDRALCECDAAFAKAHPSVTGTYDENYHLFYTTTGWDPEDPQNCVPPTGGANDPKCCGSNTSPFVIYNAYNKQCCDGEVTNLGEVC